ncbi:hypothetical protein [Arenibacter certesii]|nr:hypothetical protein [Arenibacter certesii]
MEIIEEMKPLMLFKGMWNVQGKNLPGAPIDANQPLHGTQNVTILGNNFLVAHWNYKFVDNEHFGISIIGTDNDSSQPKLHLFDNGGSYRAYDLKIEGNLWTITGETERSTMVFDKEGNTYKEHWEIKLDGKWNPLCERYGTKETVTNKENTI